MLKKLLLYFFMTLSVLLTSCHRQLPYCKGLAATSDENTMIQKLIPEFAKKTGCEVGDNCLLKWNETSNSAKFSLAWKAQCGPVIAGVYQLGDQGHGSTFVCEKTSSKTCCWPLGYDYAKEWVVCTS